jgi:uroporphyrinogen decarboxylase
VAQQTVGLQEYGVTNRSLIAGLEARGARVLCVRVYRWDLPEDTQPLRENIQALLSGMRDVLLVTSAHQVVNLLRMARHMGVEEPLRAALRRVVVGSIGPTTSEMLREEQLPVDLEPEHPKMGALVVAAAERAAALLAQKRRPVVAVRPLVPSAASGQKAPWVDSPFLKACRREPTPYTPVWLMRQAGRYMEEYRQLRGRTSFLELCKNPPLCSEIMCQAVERLGVDAAILFSDLLPILEPMGLELDFAKGEGPVIYNPVRAPADVDRVAELEDLSQLSFVMETVQLTRAALPPHLPLIGFAGAPFTLASYMIEGGASRSFVHTKTLMYRDEGAWKALMERLVRAVARYLGGQIEAGVQCVQLFDSWVGCLGPEDYRRYVLPFMQALCAQLPPGVPVIHFATGNPALLPLMRQAGGDVIGVDWRVRLDDAWQAVGHDRAIQGNLDPLVLLADEATIRQRVQEILDQAAGRPGHIFNLGHGVVPQTPVEHAVALVRLVHELSQRTV